MKKKTHATKKDRRGVYILPNLFTSCSLFGGFYAIIAAIQGRYHAAAIAILISSLFDALDGKTARYTNTSSQFGAEYDSLSDLVAFGVAPGILVFLWSLEPFGRFGWLAVFLYIICGALRLARFNVQKNDVESKHFKGLPIPGAAIFISLFIFFIDTRGGVIENKAMIALGAIYTLSFLMVSAIDYLSFKDLELFKKKPFNVLVAVILLFVIVAYKPVLMLFLFSAAYVISGPIITVYFIIQKQMKALMKHNKSSAEKKETYNTKNGL